MIHRWFKKALATRENRGASQLEAFIFLWFSFNGFAACITDKEQDAKIIKKMANCPSLRERFIKLRDTDEEFSVALKEFVELWPIFKVQDLRRLNLLNSDHRTRQEQVSYYLSTPGAEHEPSCFEFHNSQGQKIPNDWPHALHAIYRIRCNLFHGQKSLSSEMDMKIVQHAFIVLSSFLEKTNLLFIG